MLPCGSRKNHTTALTGEEMQSPLWWLAPPPCPVGSVSLDSRVAELPYESSSFAIPTSRGHYKAPLCCELLMKGLLFRALFCPRLRGKSGEAGKGEASAASQSAECLSCHMTQKSKSRNADFISIARRAIRHPLNQPAKGRPNPLNPLNLHTEGVSKGDTTTLGPKGRQT